MSLFIRDTQTVPTEGWRYPGINGHIVVVRNYGIFYDEIVKHYTANNEPAPSPEQVTAYVCEHLSIPCFDGNQPLINRWTQGLPSTIPSTCCGKK